MVELESKEEEESKESIDVDENEIKVTDANVQKYSGVVILGRALVENSSLIELK